MINRAAYYLRSKKNVRRARAALIVLLFILVTVAIWKTDSVNAFIPTNLGKIGAVLKFGAEFSGTHQSITEDAISELAAEIYGITKLNKPMRNALNQIVEANANVDKDQMTSKKHFDGESFPEGQERIVGLFKDIRSSLDVGEGQAARMKLGEALHTIQDFYSHSNWIELGNVTPYPDLGRAGRMIDRLPENEATCQECTPCITCADNITTRKLTSGYYGGEDRSKPNRNKCSHGGPRDSSTNGISGGINKDFSDCTLSPHFFLHNTALAVAKDATKQFIRDIQTAVTPQQFKLLLGIGSTLTICIDTTTSMQPIIDGVKLQAVQIVDRRLGTAEEPTKYVLAIINDPVVPEPFITTDPNLFKRAISSLNASVGGGTDCPELGMTGVLKGLGASEDGGDLFAFTDADAKDKELASQVSSLAKRKKIRVFPFLFNSTVCPSTFSATYSNLANNSGGQVFSLSQSEAGSITRLADFVVRTTAVNLLSLTGIVGNSLVTAPQLYTVPVDSTMTRVTFSISGTPSVTVRRPDGSIVQAGSRGADFVPLSTGAIFSIATPEPGNWSVIIDARGRISLAVTGESTLDLSSFKFVELGGRPGHEGAFPIDGLPLALQKNTAYAMVDGEFSTAQFELRTKEGILLQKLNLTRGEGRLANQFFGEVSLPNTEFLVYVTGLDANGRAYARHLPAAFTPQAIKITAPPSQDLRSGQTTNYAFRVTNLGQAGTFLFSGADDKGFLRAINPTIFTLGANQSKDVIVSLQPPPETPTGVSDTLTVTVESTGSDGANNFAVVISNVIGGSSGGPADIKISNTASPEQISNGSTLAYAIIVTNNGPSPATGVTVTDNLPKAVTYVTCSATHGGICGGSGNDQVVNFSSLAPGTSAIITLVTLVNCAEVSGTSLSNTATVTASNPDPDSSNNSATASVGLVPGQLKVTLEGGATALQFGPVTMAREPNPTPPSRVITLENAGCSPLSVNFIVKRTGPEVTSGKVTNTDDSATFQVHAINADGTETPGTSAQIFGGQPRRFRVVFNPMIPAPAGSITSLAAGHVLPPEITSALTIRQDGGSQTTVPLMGRISTAAKMINPLATRLSPLVALARSGDEFVTEFSVFDSNLDCYLAVYQFLDSLGRNVGDAPNFDLEQPIRQSGMLKGQSFTIVKRFTGAASRPQVNKVRVTLYDREGNESVLSGEIGKVIGRVVNVSAASFQEAGLASEAITSAFGSNLAASTQVATSSPLPTSLAGTRVFVRDSANVERLAPLFFIAPAQINYQIPRGTSTGPATVTVALNDQAVATSTVQVAAAFPGLFAANANGQGVAAAVALRVKADGSQSYEPVSIFDQAQNKFVSRPVSLGADSEQVYLVLFGTGIRYRSALSNVTARIGGIDVPVAYAGTQGGFVGLDQINLKLPRSLARSGEVGILLTVDGKPSNIVNVNVY